MKNWLIIPVCATLLVGCKKNSDPAADKSSVAGGPKGVSIQDTAESAAPPPPTAPTAAGETAPDPGTAPPPAPAGEGETVDLGGLRTALVSYMQKTGKTPDELNDLVKAGYVRSLPVAPNGYRLFYDPITVTVNMVKKW